MTLVWEGWGRLLQIQLGANELASSILVSRFIASIASRYSDAKIFEPLTTELGVVIRSLPPWLQDISLDRSGFVLGQNQRRIPIKNTIPKVSIRSVEGIATFIVLMSYHGQPVDVILSWIENLVSGKYHIISGGTLGGGEARLPFPTRDLLRRFVDGEKEADTASEQKVQCQRWMRLLTREIGSNDGLHFSSQYSQERDQRFLERLFDSRNSQGSFGPEFHTVSAGSAMIALAARVNGANVCVDCVSVRGRVTIPPESAQSSHQAPFTLCLWLRQPPPEVRANMESWIIGEDLDRSSDLPRMLPAYGGAAEIAPIVVKQLGYSGTLDGTLELWQEGEEMGKSVTWRCTREKRGLCEGGIRLHFHDDFLSSEIPAQTCPLADGY